MAFNFSPKIVTDGLVLYLDAANSKSIVSGSTTWTDLSRGGNNGTLIGGPTFNSGSGGNLIFNGASNYVTLGDNKFQYQDNFTVEAIAKFSVLPNNAGVCSSRHPIVYNHDYGYNLLVGATGLVSFQIYNTVNLNAVVSSTSSIIGSNYFHAVGIKNGTTITLYVNGILQASANLTTNAVYYLNYPFVIGGFGICGSKRFYATGNIAQTLIYNKALSSQEVLQNYNATKRRFGL